ncbi:MAG: hypothetical protein N3E37_02295 [Candidatus Micrarchaeota archaeon]|nr:hypothetical protein [Candidatus Micrarchaeota archaeon]
MLNKTYVVILALFFLGLLFAQSEGGFDRLRVVLVDLCRQLKALLPIVVVLMLIAAAVVYVAGQLLGAETRSRANVWATSMLVGAIIGVLIVLLAPPIAGALLNEPDMEC